MVHTASLPMSLHWCNFVSFEIFLSQEVILLGIEVRTLPSILQCTARPPAQSLRWPQMSTAPTAPDLHGVYCSFTSVFSVGLKRSSTDTPVSYDEVGAFFSFLCPLPPSPCSLLEAGFLHQSACALPAVIAITSMPA